MMNFSTQGPEEQLALEAQRAICNWFKERHCKKDIYGIPRCDPLPPLELAYEALLALENAGIKVVRYES